MAYASHFIAFLGGISFTVGLLWMGRVINEYRRLEAAGDPNEGGF